VVVADSNPKPTLSIADVDRCSDELKAAVANLQSASADTVDEAEQVARLARAKRHVSRPLPTPEEDITSRFAPLKTASNPNMKAVRLPGK
jgi:hypothetical protein